MEEMKLYNIFDDCVTRRNTPPLLLSKFSAMMFCIAKSPSSCVYHSLSINVNSCAFKFNNNNKIFKYMWVAEPNNKRLWEESLHVWAPLHINEI